MGFLRRLSLSAINTTKKEENMNTPDEKTQQNKSQSVSNAVSQKQSEAEADIKVHYNSDKPAQLQALAYAQGTDIHLPSGQEKHLPHEEWHTVQQKQGRVEPTMQMKGNVNDEVELEKEADVMGGKISSSPTDAVL